MPTQLNYVKGEWLDREEELLLRRAELLSEKKDLVTQKDDFAARMSAGPPTSVHPKSAAVVGSQVPKDLVTAADGLLCLGGGILGIILGHGLVFIAAPIIEARSGLLINPFAFSSVELILLPVLVVLASLVGFIPAMTAYRTDVASTLSD